MIPTFSTAPKVRSDVIKNSSVTQSSADHNRTNALLISVVLLFLLTEFPQGKDVTCQKATSLLDILAKRFAIQRKIDCSLF